MKDQRRQDRSLHSPAEHAPSLRDATVVALALVGAALAVARFDDRPACGLKRVPISTALTWRRPPPEPVVLAPFHANSELRIRTARAALLRDHGDARVHLTSSNSFSEGAVEASLAEYLAATPSGGRANESFYLFGPPTDARLAKLVASYEFPKCGGAWCRPSNLAASFGVAGRDSGVSYHTHGSGFGEVLHGRKRWLLYVPSASPPPGHEPDVSTAAWVRDVLPTLPPHRRPRHDCVLGPGEVLYFPPSWWHATLNEDAHTVFVSSFASDQARDEGPAFLGA